MSTPGPNTMSAEELMALNQQLNERIAALEAETRPPQRPKVNRPTPFKGDRPKLRTFLAQMDLYFAANAITRDNDQVLSAATYLEGTALDWFEPRLRSWFHETPEERDAETNAIFNSYAEFVKRLKITFGDTDEKVSAAQRLNRLNQKGSAAHYASEFQQISSHLEWDEQALADRFYRGLRDNVKDEIARLEHRPTTIHAMIEAAVRIDNRLFERKMERNGGANHVRQSKGPRNNLTRKDNYGYAPMELDATVNGKLTNEERQRRRKLGLCYFCGKPGHRLAECTLKDKDNKALRAVMKGNLSDQDAKEFQDEGDTNYLRATTFSADNKLLDVTGSDINDLKTTTVDCTTMIHDKNTKNLRHSSFSGNEEAVSN